MAFLITALIAALILLPLVYELPNYVYGRQNKTLSFLHFKKRVYIPLLVTVFTVLYIDGFLMLNSSTGITGVNARVWTGALIGTLTLLYFLRLIPIYYDEDFSVQGRKRLLGAYIRELCAITVFGAALFTISFYVWSFVLDGCVLLFLYLARTHKYFKIKKTFR